MLNFNFIIYLIFSNVSGLPVIKILSTRTNITSSNIPLSSFLYKIQESALLFFMLRYLIKYLARSINHKRTASKFPYIDFTNILQYYSRNSFMMMPRFTLSSGPRMTISAGISGCRNMLLRHIDQKTIFILRKKRLVR